MANVVKNIDTKETQKGAAFKEAAKNVKKRNPGNLVDLTKVIDF
jgi:hypothetical protein